MSVDTIVMPTDVDRRVVHRHTAEVVHGNERARAGPPGEEEWDRALP